MAGVAASAQSTTQLPLFDGALLLSVEGGIRQDVRADDGALVEFWRPVTFGPADAPIGGRMDCRLAGAREDYSDALFDVRRRYKDERRTRRKSGMRDDRTTFSETGSVRRLEVTGHTDAGAAQDAQPRVWQRYSANTPEAEPLAEGHRHYVLTYLAMRADPYLYDIRLNCEFRHLEEPDGKTDYAAIMHRYVDIGVPIAEPNSDAETAPSPQAPDS